VGQEFDLSDDKPKSDHADISISGRAIALAVAENDSLATILHNSGLELRDRSVAKRRQK
jgi:hypothetical protein